MPMLRAVMLMLGVFAVLFLGAVSTPTFADAGPPPCHEAPPDHGPAHDSDKATSAMACCVACVASQAPVPANETLVVHAALPSPATASEWVGREPRPEPGPPRD